MLQLTDYQRNIIKYFNPEKWAKATHAKFHSTPALLLQGSIPNIIPPNEAKTLTGIEFFITSSCFFNTTQEPKQQLLQNIEILQKPGKTKFPKIAILTGQTAIAVIPPSENYYFAALGLAEMKDTIEYLIITPNKKPKDPTKPYQYRVDALFKITAEL